MDNVLADAGKRPCPEPVLMTKKALDATKEGDVVVALEDNEVSRDNVIGQRASLEVKEQEGQFEVTIGKGHWQEQIDVKLSMKEALIGEYVILISRDTFGEGAQELGALLLKSYLHSLSQAQVAPSAILFVNRGVFVVARGSASIDTLKTLEARGVEIMVCGTCLDYYILRGELGVGKITDMDEIVERTTQVRTLTL